MRAIKPFERRRCRNRCCGIGVKTKKEYNDRAKTENLRLVSGNTIEKRRFVYNLIHPTDTSMFIITDTSRFENTHTRTQQHRARSTRAAPRLGCCTRALPFSVSCRKGREGRRCKLARRAHRDDALLLLLLPRVTLCSSFPTGSTPGRRGKGPLRRRRSPLAPSRVFRIHVCGHASVVRRGPRFLRPGLVYFISADRASIVRATLRATLHITRHTRGETQAESRPAVSHGAVSPSR